MSGFHVPIVKLHDLIGIDQEITTTTTTTITKVAGLLGGGGGDDGVDGVGVGGDSGVDCLLSFA